MLVNRTLDYALRSLTYMGNSSVPTLSMKEISEEEHIPLNYLAKVMRKLVNQGIVGSRVGPSGGYTLSRPPEDIKLRDIYEAIEGEIDSTADCIDDDAVCYFFESCPQIPVWDKLRLYMIKVLEGTTLDEMMRNGSGNLGEIRFK